MKKKIILKHLRLLSGYKSEIKPKKINPCVLIDNQTFKNVGVFLCATS
jgi:hypothetical protein